MDPLAPGPERTEGYRVHVCPAVTAHRFCTGRFFVHTISKGYYCPDFLPAYSCSSRFAASEQGDKSFIFRHLEQPVMALYLEYMAGTLPFILAVLVTPYWYAFLLMQAAFYGIAHIRTTPATKTWFHALSKLIPARDFEWLSGVRKGAPLLLFFISLP
jgi:hypothetical protein